jgi:signal transduction histidine kinase
MSKRWLRRGALTAVLVLLAAPSIEAAQETAPVRQVLVLHSFDRGNLSLDDFTANFRVDLDQRLGAPVSVVEFVVTPAGFLEPPEKAIVAFLQSAFSDRPRPDLIVTVGGSAAAFARRHRQLLFPETPLLFGAVDQRFLQDTPLAENETAVAVANDIPRLVDDILLLFPRTRQVFMVIGSGEIGKFWHRQLEGDFQRFHDRLTFVWTQDLSFAEVLRRSSSLPPDSAILYVTFDVDAQGGAYADERVLGELRAVANAPLFATQSAQLGYGVFGGTMMSNDTLGRRAADVAIRILKGESPGTIRIPPQQTGPPRFDWRELRRWSVDESRLPPGSDVWFQGPSLWRDYRQEVLGVLGALGVQSLLILGLLYQRRARQRAEDDSRRHLALAADANRRVTMSALTGSIAHELSQPLNSILHNAKAGEMLVTSKRATPEVLQEILSDIRTADERATQIIERHRTMLRNHQIEKKPIDIHAVVRESLAFIAHDTNARQTQVDIDLPSDPCVVSGDPVLLQQVLVNLVINAMDAMADTPPERRRIRIHNDVGKQSVTVSVRDAGTGLPERIDGRLFEPFVTTKSNGMGIGLTIARTIVEAHGGTMDARNNLEGIGATFKVTLPRDGMTRIP